MSEVQQEGAAAIGAPGAPAVPNDPATFAGPGVTQNPDNASQVFDLAAVAEENAQLRAQLISENDRLKTALADSRASGLTFQGLEDEDVRRIEHPEEYTEEYAALGAHAELTSLVGSLSQRLALAEQTIAQANAQPVQPTADTTVTGAPGDVETVVPANDPTPPVAGGVDLSTLSDAELADELARREDADAAAPPA